MLNAPVHSWLLAIHSLISACVGVWLVVAFARAGHAPLPPLFAAGQVVALAAEVAIVSWLLSTPPARTCTVLVQLSVTPPRIGERAAGYARNAVRGPDGDMDRGGPHHARLHQR